MGETIKKYIKIVINSNGCMVRGHELPNDLKELNAAVFSDDDMLTPEADRINLRNDINRVKRGFNKSFNQYREEVVHG